jgi:hypothetical protein
MRTQIRDEDTSTFRIRRSILKTNGIGSEVDQNVSRLLKEIEELLGKPVFGRSNASAKPAAKRKAAAVAPVTASPTAAAGVTGAASPSATTMGAPAALAGAAAAPASAAGGVGVSSAPIEIRNFFNLVLSAKHSPKGAGDVTSWDSGSLGDVLTLASAKSGYSLSDHIDKTPPLAKLKYYVAGDIRDNWKTISFNSCAVLEDHPNIQDYLIAYAYYKLNIVEEDALRHVIINNRAGTRVFSDYAAVSAARYLIEQEQLKVEDYNKTSGKFTKQLIERGLPLSSVSFEKSLRDEIREFMFDRDEEDIIRKATIFPMLPPDLLPDLIKYLQHSPLRPQITEKTIDLYLPSIAVQLLRQSTVPSFGTVPTVADQSYHVQFEDDSQDAAIEVSKEAVLFASQLYHGMVLGDELDVFGAVHYLAHRRMNVFGGMRIKDRTLRDDLQRYVFDNRYLDLGDRSQSPPPTPIEKFRTRPAERQMFHRQVFDEGTAEMPEDMLVNRDFKRLWKVLMLEAARYLDRAQASLNPDSYVSRQNVMQAVEDLQYNLSTHCTGMATVISPALDGELNFILERILKHDEVLQQILPEGGNWKRAVDKLNQERRRPAGSAMTLYNKAVLGKDIIEMIANYVPSDFERNSVFSGFIGKVDAYITTQSILQRSLKPMLEFHEEEEAADSSDTEMPHVMPPEQMKPSNGSSASADEWDF